LDGHAFFGHDEAPWTVFTGVASYFTEKLSSCEVFQMPIESIFEPEKTDLD
jgi:hypothetical protein